jgi:acetylornithine deacetylase
MGKREIDRDRLYSLFQEMVDIYSPSGKEEELTRYLAEYLDGTDLGVVLRPVDETRRNLEISAKRAVPDLLFLGHIDTVPAFDIEEYEFSEEEGVCYGLGTTDMKGGCAALIEAFLSAEEGGFLPRNVMLSLVVGEEESGDGTEALLEAYQFKHALVAEPTAMIPCSSHYGYVEMVLSIFGYRRHAAMSNLDTHSIRAMLRLLLQLEERIDGLDQDSVLNIRDLHSSESGFAAPDRCSASIDLHLPPDKDVKAYAQELDAFFRDYLDAGSVTGYEIEMPFATDGYQIEKDNYLLKKTEEVFRGLSLAWEPGAFRSHSDANLLRDAGCSPLILGPGYLAAAHTRDEFVEFDQVAQAAQVYTDLLAALC